MANTRVRLNQGGTEMTVEDGAQITIESGGALRAASGAILDLPSSLAVESGETFSVNAGGTLDAQASSTVKLAGASSVESGGVLTVKSGGKETVASGGILEAVSGGNVNLETGAVQTVKSGARIALQGLLDVETSEWDDLRVPITSVRVGATIREPAWAKFKDNGSGLDGVYALDFSNSQEQEVFFAAQLPHTWKQGTAIKPHVHFALKGGGTGAVKWGLEYTVQSVNGVFGATSIIYGTFSASSEVANTHRLTSLTDIVMTGHLISCQLVCRLFRDITVASNLAAVATLLEIDFHYEKDTFGGSRSHSSK